MTPEHKLDTNIYIATALGLSPLPRMGKMTPDGYRLAKKPDGTLILQGAFLWSQGISGGHEWHDIPTVDL